MCSTFQSNLNSAILSLFRLLHSLFHHGRPSSEVQRFCNARADALRCDRIDQVTHKSLTTRPWLLERGEVATTLQNPTFYPFAMDCFAFIVLYSCVRQQMLSFIGRKHNALLSEDVTSRCPQIPYSSQGRCSYRCVEAVYVISRLLAIAPFGIEPGLHHKRAYVGDRLLKPSGRESQRVVRP